MSKYKSWKEELIFLHLEDIRTKAPGFFKASGGYSMKIKPYSDTNTNALTRCVKDFLTYKGHYVIRTARQGQARIEKIPIGGTQKDISGRGVKHYDKLSFTKNPEAKAFTDLQASINGLYIAIEIKCKATKDRIKEEQIKNQKCVEKSGAIHLIIPTMQAMWEWYYNELPIILKQKFK